MITLIIKSFIAVLLFALAELVIISVFPSVQPLTHGLVAFSLIMSFLLFFFARYVDKQEKVCGTIEKLSSAIGVENIKRLSPIASNEDAVVEFLQRFALNYEATLCDYEQKLASLQATNNDLQNKLKQVVSDYEQLQSKSFAQQSEFERRISDLNLQLARYKAKYEVLETGTDEQKAAHLRNMYFSAKNRINAKSNGKVE